MACATLKRSLDLDPICNRPSKRRRYNLTATASSPLPKDEEPSPFVEATPKLNMDEISASIKEQMKRLHRRKKLRESPSPGPSSPEPGSPSNKDREKDKHLFTFSQVGMICERLLKEREDSLREIYDHVLTAKLQVQYDTFVKFTHDQIQKKFESSAAPSYLS